MTDPELIQALHSGDKNAFRFLVEQNQNLVFRTAMGFLHQQEDAEDITQEIFIKVYQQIQYFTGDASVSTWLYRITVNHCLNHLRRKKRLEFFSFAEELFLQIVNKASDDKAPDEDFSEDDTRMQIQAAIESLNEKQRTAFVLSKYDELSQREIAVIMQISEGAVEQLLQRAKKNLQKKLAYLVGK